MEENNKNSEDKDSNYSDFIIGEESEPYLGPSWAILMFILYILKQAFPAEPYSAYWYFQIYILLIVAGITVFTLIKRHRFFNQEEDKSDLPKDINNS